MPGPMLVLIQAMVLRQVGLGTRHVPKIMAGLLAPQVVMSWSRKCVVLSPAIGFCLLPCPR